MGQKRLAAAADHAAGSGWGLGRLPLSDMQWSAPQCQAVGATVWSAPHRRAGSGALPLGQAACAVEHSELVMELPTVLGGV
jgi:hypothetical protein